MCEGVCAHVCGCIWCGPVFQATRRVWVVNGPVVTPKGEKDSGLCPERDWPVGVEYFTELVWGWGGWAATSSLVPTADTSPETSYVNGNVVA